MDKTKPMTEDNTPSRGRYGITHKFSLAMQHDYRCSTQDDLLAGPTSQAFHVQHRQRQRGPTCASIAKSRAA